MFAAVDGVLRAFFYVASCVFVSLFVCLCGFAAWKKRRSSSSRSLRWRWGKKKTRLPEGPCAAGVTSPLGSHSASAEKKNPLRNTRLCFE